MNMKSGSFAGVAMAASLALIITGCGGSSSSGGGGSEGDNAETGIFSDSPVAGVAYRTETRSGTTSAIGEFKYQPDETVTFSIGDVDLPSVPATGRITPLDMGEVAADGTLSNEIINVLRLLQSLDEDGDPDNGIQVPKDALIGVAPDFSAPPAQFESEVGIALISEAQATAHFTDSELANLRKSWVYTEPNGSVNVLTFVSDSEYIIAHSQADDGDQIAASAEYGTYTLDPITGEFEVSVKEQSDCSGGLGDSNWTLRFDGADLVLTSAGDDEQEAVRFNAVESDRDPLIGGWLIREGEVFNVLTFLDDSRYVVAHNGNEEAYGDSEALSCEGAVVYEAGSPHAVSSEWGSYRYSGGKLNITAVHDETDGPGGLYDATGNMGMTGPMELSPYGDLYIEPDSEGAFSARRIGRFEVALKDLGGNKTTRVVERTELFDGGAMEFEFDLVGEEPYTARPQLDSNGSGSFDLGDEINVIEEWRVRPGSGTLQFAERAGDGSVGHWAVAPIRTSDGSPKALVNLSESGSGGSVALFISELRESD